MTQLMTALGNWLNVVGPMLAADMDSNGTADLADIVCKAGAGIGEVISAIANILLNMP